MDIATSEVGYTPAMPSREDHEVHKEHVVALEYIYIYIFAYGLFNFFITQQPLVSLGLLTVEFSRSHSDTPHSVGLLWTKYWSVADKT